LTNYKYKKFSELKPGDVFSFLFSEEHLYLVVDTDKDLNDRTVLKILSYCNKTETVIRDSYSFVMVYDARN
jgi:hypothetical protein